MSLNKNEEKNIFLMIEKFRKEANIYVSMDNSEFQKIKKTTVLIYLLLTEEEVWRGNQKKQKERVERNIESRETEGVEMRGEGLYMEFTFCKG